MRTFLDLLKPLWQPHAGQLEFLLNPSKFKVLACGRRWGKTDACVVQILHALHRPFPTKHLVLAPTADQAALVFERAVQLLDAFREQRLSPQESPDPKVKRSPFPHLRFGRHVVMARSGHVPRSLRGNEATHIVVDEAAYLPESLITEVAMPMLATTDGYLTLISTPHGKNHFWRFFGMGQRGENGIWSRQAPTSESPYVSDSFLHVQRQLLSERAFAVEYEADFRDSVGQVFKTDSVQACLVAATPTLTGPYVIGIDWARYSDYTAVVVLSGDRDRAWLASTAHFNGQTWDRIVKKVVEIVNRFPEATIVCDSTGAGDVVHELLTTALPYHHIVGVQFSNKTKVELIDNLSWLIDSNSLRMQPDPELLRELEHFEARTTESGNTKLSARSGYHDDLVIALALAARGLHTNYKPQIAIGQPRRFSQTS